MKKITLCSEGKCCPEALIEGDEVVVVDDAGNRVTLTREQVGILWKNLE